MRYKKHFRSVFSAFLAAALLPALTGCAEEVEEIPPAPVITPPETFIFDWQEPYKIILDEFQGSEGFSEADSRFDLRDITGDGIPELFISPDTQKLTHCRIYSYSGGAVSELGEYGSEGCLPWLPERDLFNDEFVGDSYIIGKYMFLENGEFKTYLSYADNSSAAASGAVIIHEINGESVTLPQYDAAMAEFDEAALIKLGRRFTFGAAAVEYGLHSSEAWGRVLTEKQRAQLSDKLSSELVNEKASHAGAVYAAFELCDLNDDDVPELVISDGQGEHSECRIFCFTGDTLEDLTEIKDSFGASGCFTLDLENSVFFTDTSSCRSVSSMLGSEGLTDFVPSDSLAVCGRKLLLTENNISSALDSGLSGNAGNDDTEGSNSTDDTAGDDEGSEDTPDFSDDDAGLAASEA